VQGILKRLGLGLIAIREYCSSSFGLNDLQVDSGIVLGPVYAEKGAERLGGTSFFSDDGTHIGCANMERDKGSHLVNGTFG
jgi:hypothetical protein